MKNLIAKNDKYIKSILKDKTYKIYQNGKIYSLITKTGKISVSRSWRRIDRINSQGYFVIKYKSKQLYVHRIIYMKFIGKLNNKKVINHKDCNPKNNNIRNLELVSQLENNIHKIENHQNHGGSLGSYKINFKIAEQIRTDRLIGFSLNDLCKKYKISKSTASSVVNYKTWTADKKHIYEKKTYIINHSRFKNSIPKWLDGKEINFIYKNKPKGMNVDHIIPLKNKFVSGLHVPWNLQYLKKSDNFKKNSQFDFTYDNQSWKSKKSSKRKR